VEPLTRRPRGRGSVLWPVRPFSHSPQATETRPQRTSIWRRHVGVTDNGPAVLFCGKLIERTQLLPSAQWWVRGELPDWLMLAWDEPMRMDIETAKEHLGIAGVCVLGFNQSDLPAACTAANVFLLPSALHKTWDLVVNEAAISGLPMVVSDTVGCADDLVLHNWSGFIVPHRSVEKLASTLYTPTGDASLRRMFGEPNRCMTDDCTIQRCAGEIVAACLSTVGAA
jgi:glycosyltransferase involved in cell wall biosynthesis